MKKALILTMIFFSINAFAQKKTKCKQLTNKVFELDLASPDKNALKPLCEESGKGLSIRTWQTISFKLKNPNPFKYKYEINHKLVDVFEGQEGNPIEKAKEISFAKSDGLKANKANTSQDDVLERQAKEKELEEKLKKAKDNLEKQNLLKLELTKEIERLKDKKELVKTEMNELVVKLKKDESFYNKNSKSANEISLESSIELYKKKSQDQIAQYDKLIENIDNEIEKLEIEKEGYTSKFKLKELQNEIDNLRLHEEQIQLEKDKKAIAKKDVNLKLTITKQSVKNLLAEIDSYIIKMSAEDYLYKDSFKNALSGFESKFQEEINQINQITNETSDIQDESFIEKYNANLKDFEKNQLSKIRAAINKMSAMKLDNYNLPIDFNGKNIDLVQISLKKHHVSAKETSSPEPISYNIWVKGGVKIDVSAGAFITSLVDGQYSVSNKTSTDGQGNEETFQVITHDNPGRFQYGFGSLINISPRWGTAWVKPTLNVGALFASDQKFQFLFGGGLVLGKDQRIILHGGLSMGAITSLNDNFKADGQSRYNLGEVTAPPTQEKFSFGHFFGVTYNFGKIKSQDKTTDK